MRRVLTLAIAAVFVATLTAAPVGAEIVPDLEFGLAEDGVLEVGGFDDPIPIPAGGTGFVGDWDDETGDFVGEMVIGPIEPFVLEDPLPVGVDIALSGDPITGTMDPETGDVDLDTAVSVAVALFLPPEAPDPIANCTISPTALELSSSNPGGEPFDPELPPEEWTFALADQGFVIDSAACDNPEIADLLNNTLDLPTEDTAILLSFQFGIDDPTPPGPPAPPAPPAEAEAEERPSPPSPVRETPRFTG